MVSLANSIPCMLLLLSLGRSGQKEIWPGFAKGDWRKMTREKRRKRGET